VLPCCNGAEGRAKGEGPPYEVGVECGLEVDPHKVSTLIFLNRQDVSNKVVPVEEPSLPEDIQDFKHGGAVLLNPFQGRVDGTGGRRGRRCQFHLLIGKGEDRGGKLSRRHRDDGSKKARSCSQT